jgi:phosphohistidine phosphatase SixA
MPSSRLPGSPVPARIARPARWTGRALLAASLLLAAAAPALAQQAAAAPAAAGARATAAGATTIILVRHAEKADVPGGDPPLSPAGEARSLALLDALRSAGVQAVVTTQLQRTRLTAAPLARELGLEPEVVPASADVAAHARQVAEHVLARHAGKTVVVVGHSNTVPAIAAALGAGSVGAIDDSTYDDLFIVLKPAEGAARHLHVRYGSASGAAHTGGAMVPPRRP